MLSKLLKTLPHLTLMLILLFFLLIELILFGASSLSMSSNSIDSLQWINQSLSGNSTQKLAQLEQDVETDIISPSTSNTVITGFGYKAYATSSTSLQGFNTWTSNGPEGGWVTSLAIDQLNSDILYAGTYKGGFYKSSNGGVDWFAINNGLPIIHEVMQAAAVDPINTSIVYTCGLSGCYKSVNGGQSWAPSGNGMPNGVKVLAIAPSSTTTLYAGTVFNGVYKSTDGGASWSQINIGLPMSFIQFLVIDPSNSAVVYAGDWSNGIYKTTNGGGSWIATNNGLPVNAAISGLVITASGPSTLYAAGSGVYKSTNGGASWVSINSGLSVGDGVRAIAVDPSDPSTLYVSGNGLYKTINGGTSWNQISLISFYSPLVIDPNNSATLYAALTVGGVYKSTNAGVNWNQVNKGLKSSLSSVN